MSQTIINDIPPRVQAVATNGQTIYGTQFTANYPSDVLVYSRAAGVDADDATQQVPYPSGYNVTFVGSLQQVQVELITPSTLSDIVTIVRMTPADRENLYNNTNFLPTMLNNDFGILTLVDQQAQLVNDQIAPRYNYSAIINPNPSYPTMDTILPILPANSTWIKNANDTAIIAAIFPENGAASRIDTYVTMTDETADEPNSFPLSLVAQGFMVNLPGTTNIVSRTILGTANQIDVFNGNGATDNPTIAITDNVILSGTAGMGVPQGTTAERVIPTLGIGLRYNTSINSLEYYDADIASWVLLPSGGVGAYLPLGGGTMSGNIDMNGNNVLNIANASFVSGAFSQSFTSGTLSANLNYVLPTSFPSVNGYILASNTSGIMSWIANTAGSMVSVVGTANQIDVDATDPQNPILSLSATLDAPGTFTIQSTVDLNAIIDDDTFATATATNIPTAESVKVYVANNAGSISQAMLLMGG